MHIPKKKKRDDISHDVIWVSRSFIVLILTLLVLFGVFMQKRPHQESNMGLVVYRGQLNRTFFVWFDKNSGKQLHQVLGFGGDNSHIYEVQEDRVLMTIHWVTGGYSLFVYDYNIDEFNLSHRFDMSEYFAERGIEANVLRADFYQRDFVALTLYITNPSDGIHRIQHYMYQISTGVMNIRAPSLTINDVINSSIGLRYMISPDEWVEYSASLGLRYWNSNNDHAVSIQTPKQSLDNMSEIFYAH